MAAKVTTAEICENAKLARDSALIGDYDSASIYYEGLQSMLGKAMVETPDSLMKGKWKMVSLDFLSHSLFRRQWVDVSNGSNSISDP